MELHHIFLWLRRHAHLPQLSPAVAIALLLGTVAPVLFAWLLPAVVVWPLLAVALATLILLPRAHVLAWFVIGFSLATLHAGAGMAARLPAELEGDDLRVRGSVVGLPTAADDGVRFLFRVDSAEHGSEMLDWHGLVRLSWYQGAPDGVPACSRWQLQVRLKRPRGTVNPGGFDFERHALQRGIHATGYVRDHGTTNQQQGARVWCIDPMRERLSAQIAQRVDHVHAARLLQAFTVGDTRGLEPDDWQVARANGIPHLLAISGLHIGIAAGLGALLVRALWWLLPGLALRWPRPLAQAPAAFVMALGYGFLAGNSLPTLRALAMIGVVVFSQASRRQVRGMHSLALAMIFILLLDPLAVLAPGFWLSFLGVAFLMLCLSRGRGWRGLVKEVGGAQVVSSIALLPLTVWFFGEASLVSALSNLVAVPLVSLLVVPLCLLGVILLLLVPAWATPPLQAAAALMQWQWHLLEITAAWPWAHWHAPRIGVVQLLLAVAGALWLLALRGLPARFLGALLFLPLAFARPQLIADGDFRVTVIDVGQGLAVLVRTNSHALLYDTGPRFRSGFNMGEAAVLPTLRALAVPQVDLIVVSHGDSDHAGGHEPLAAVYPRAQHWAGEPERAALPTMQCRAGQELQWDGVRLRVLAPTRALIDLGDGNDRSCVLLVEGAAGRLLLTGDIGARGERQLVHLLDVTGDDLPRVLVVPHHGSHSSSTDVLLDTFAPQLALNSSGHRNRYGHPHDDVRMRYRQRGIVWHDTAQDGYVEVRLEQRAAPSVLLGRDTPARYWRE